MTQASPVATQEPRKRGRPTKLTPEVQTAILAAIQAGTTTKQAARIAGIHRAAIYRRVAAGRQPGAPEDLREFAAAFARAGAERSRKSVTREPITDGEGREIGTRVTRRLKNRTVEVTEEFARAGAGPARSGVWVGRGTEWRSLEELFVPAEAV
jgi:hypothetical protein